MLDKSTIDIGQFLKALAPIEVRLDIPVIEDNEVHPTNADQPILVHVEGNVIDVKDVQLANIPSLIVVKESGKFTEFNDAHPLKQ